MASINVCSLLGRVGRDPEVKHLDSGNAVANFTVATSETFKDKQGNKQETVEWHNVVAWGKTAEIVEKYVQKGDLIFVTGKIHYDSYQDKDGNKRSTTKIQAQQVVLLGNKRSNNEDVPAKLEDQQSAEPETEGDLPF